MEIFFNKRNVDAQWTKLEILKFIENFNFLEQFCGSTTIRNLINIKQNINLDYFIFRSYFMWSHKLSSQILELLLFIKDFIQN